MEGKLNVYQKTLDILTKLVAPKDNYNEFGSESSVVS